MPAKTLTYIVGIGLYSVVVLIAVVTYLRRCCKTQTKRSSQGAKDRQRIIQKQQALFVQSVFKALLMLFLLARIAWCACNIYTNSLYPPGGQNSTVTDSSSTFDFEQADVTEPVPVVLSKDPLQIGSFIINRVSFGFLFSAFTLVVFYWAETVHKSYYESVAFLPTLGVFFVVSNVVVWIFKIVVITLFASEGNNVWEGDPVYETSIVLDTSILGIISLGFFVYGARLAFRKLKADDKDPRRLREAIKIISTAFTFTLCFLLGVMMFSFRPLTGQYLQNDLFTVLAYYVPEILPSLLQIYLVETGRGVSQRTSQYINDLYAERVDTTFDEAVKNPVDESSDSGYFSSTSQSTTPESHSMSSSISSTPSMQLSALRNAVRTSRSNVQGQKPNVRTPLL